MKPRIIYFVTSPISANIFGIHQIKYLHNEGFEVYLLCSPGVLDDELTQYTENIYTIKNLRRNISIFNDFKSIFEVIVILKFLKPCVVVYSTPKAALIGAIASFVTNTRIRIYQVWGLRWQQISGVKFSVIRFFDLLAMSMSTHVTVVSSSLLDLLRKYSKKKNLFVLGSGSTIGVNSSIFNYSNRGVRFKDEKVIGFAGRLANDKGIDQIFVLFSNLLNHFPNLRLELIGDLDSSDEISNTLITNIQNHPLITWIPQLPQLQLAKYMRNWDLQIFLSKREGLGNVILESGACGVPTFCWDIIGSKDAIPYFAQDFLIPYGDMEFLEKSVKNYLRYPLDHSKKIQLSQWYLENFEQKKVLSDFVGFIDSNLKVCYGLK